MIPPALIQIKIVESGKIKIWLPIPVFIVWPFLLILLLLLSPFLVVLLMVYPFISGVRSFFDGFINIWTLLCSLKGLKVDVQDEDDHVFVKII